MSKYEIERRDGKNSYGCYKKQLGCCCTLAVNLTTTNNCLTQCKGLQSCWALDVFVTMVLDYSHSVCETVRQTNLRSLGKRTRLGNTKTSD